MEPQTTINTIHKSDYKRVDGSHLPGLKIGKVSRIAFHSLTALSALATVAVFTAAILTKAVPLAALVVTMVALGILLTAQAASLSRPHLPKNAQRVLNLIRATMVDLLAVTALVLLYPIKQSWFDPKLCDAGQSPILLVHGYLHNSSGWAYHKYQYRKAGFKNVFTVDLGHPLQSIEDYSKVVQKKVEEIKQKTGRKDIRLIGHSMGGVVSAHYALHYAGADGTEVKDLITLGSPLMGTRVAPIGVGECSKEMCFGSDYISKLSHSLKTSAIPQFNQGSKADLIIFPYRSSINDQGGKGSLVYRDLGHASFMLSDRVIQANIRRLRLTQ